MKFAILGSGSSGNSSFIQMGNKKFLIDAGFSGKRTVEKLESINENIETLDGIFITHEHTDHVQGLGVLSRKYKIPIYMHKITFDTVKEKIGKIDPEHLNFIESDKISFGNCVVTNFEVMHDANICLGYTFEYNDKKLSYASDIGNVNNVIRENFKNSDVIVIESNYDYNMLMNGPYHWELKNRVKGKYGHLSNAEASKFVCSVQSNKLKKVYLMHISKDNNTPELAHCSLKEMLTRDKKHEIQIEVALEKETKLYEV